MKRTYLLLPMVLALVLSACGVGENSVFSLVVGDCFDAPLTGEVDEITKFACTESHEYEVFDSLQVTGVEFDGEAIENQAIEGCLASFDGYVGIAYAESIYELNWLTPTSESWDADDREILCILYEPDGRKTESAANAAK